MAGNDWVVQAAAMTPELREFILKTEPEHDWDDSYERYAFDGDSINDENVWIEEDKPEGFRLRYCFKVQDRYVWIWRSNGVDVELFSASYWIEAKKESPGKRREVISVDFESMTMNTVLKDAYRGLFDALKRAVALNKVSYSSPEAFYLVQLIYSGV